MRFGSVCSGIEAASMAWNPLGWQAQFFSEIEPFPCEVLKHHYPDVPNHGDMSNFKDWPDHAIDLLCGGTPCQSFSVAGLRKGLDDPRGNLMLTFGAIAARYRPKWLVWENVPGVLSSNGGRDFGSFLGLLGELGYGFAYRVLDAQYAGLAQRRKRVFVVGCLGDWRSAAAVLFERHSLSGHPAPSRQARQAGQRPAGTISSRTTGGGGLGTDFELGGGLIPALHADISPAIKARDYKGPSSDGDGAILVPMVTRALTGNGFDASEDGTGRGTPLVPITFDDQRGRDNGGFGFDHARTLHSAKGQSEVQLVAFDTTQITSRANRCNPKAGDPCHPIAAGAHAPAIAFDDRQSDVLQYGEKTGPLDTNGTSIGLLSGMQVRRLTPRECERLQGFPDDYTLIERKGKPAADGPRYKALGNSWAVPVVRWIGGRIDMVNAIATERAAA